MSNNRNGYILVNLKTLKQQLDSRNQPFVDKEAAIAFIKQNGLSELEYSILSIREMAEIIHAALNEEI